MPVIPASVATTPPTISMIALLLGEPVKKRATSLLTELNACPPKYNNTIPPTISASENRFGHLMLSVGFDRRKCRGATSARPSRILGACTSRVDWLT
jgi:hypothetical protein